MCPSRHHSARPLTFVATANTPTVEPSLYGARLCDGHHVVSSADHAVATVSPRRSTSRLRWLLYVATSLTAPHQVIQLVVASTSPRRLTAWCPQGPQPLRCPHVTASPDYAVVTMTPHCPVTQWLHIGTACGPGYVPQSVSSPRGTTLMLIHLRPIAPTVAPRCHGT